MTLLCVLLNNLFFQNGVANNMEDQDGIFEAEILKSIEWGSGKATFRNISPDNPGDNLVLRPLAKGDFHKGKINIIHFSETNAKHNVSGMTRYTYKLL